MTTLYNITFQGSGGSAPDAYPYAPKRSRSLDKRGSKSLDSTNDGKDGVASRRMSTIGSISGTSGCNMGKIRKLSSMKFRRVSLISKMFYEKLITFIKFKT